MDVKQLVMDVVQQLALAALVNAQVAQVVAQASARVVKVLVVNLVLLVVNMNVKVDAEMVVLIVVGN